MSVDLIAKFDTFFIYLVFRSNLESRFKDSILHLLEMLKLRNSFILSTVWFFMALHILNLSIDSPDRLPDTIPEDLRINDIESFAELIVEHVFGFENAISEHDETDYEGGLSFGSNKLLFYCKSCSKLSFLPKSNCFESLVKISFTNEWIISQFSPSIVSPPPRLLA